MLSSQYQFIKSKGEEVLLVTCHSHGFLVYSTGGRDKERVCLGGVAFLRMKGTALAA